MGRVQDNYRHYFAVADMEGCYKLTPCNLFVYSDD